MKRLMLASIATILSLGLLQSADAGNRGGNGGTRSGNVQIKFNGGGSNFIKSHNTQPLRVVQSQPSFQQPFKVQPINKGSHFGIHQFQGNKFLRNIQIAAPKYNYSLVKNPSYHLQFGRKFDYGYCYVGAQHVHWVSTVYSPDCGCTIYFDPCTQVWYYWCPPDGCFYPVTYCPYGVYVF